jgi:F-type H+-transporting ATPase subunit a
VVISPDQVEIWQIGPFTINATIMFTWVVIILLVGGSWLITRNLTSEASMSRGQNALETIVSLVSDQIEEISKTSAAPYLPFVGTLFIFIATSSILSIVPGFRPPTGSLSTTTALAICVFFAVPIYGINRQGLRNYLAQYLQPSPLMLPFNIIGEFSRTLALAVRLFGNIMSGTMIAAILVTILPIFFPVIMEAFSLLIGLIQAYIFAVLAMVYIASAMRSHAGIEAPARSTESTQNTEGDETNGNG